MRIEKNTLVTLRVILRLIFNTTLPYEFCYTYYMNIDKVIRNDLISLLESGHAHMTLSDAVKDFPMEKINTIFPNGDYSSWQLLEHIRRTQADILDFIKNPHYKELTWPNDYWPSKKQKAKQKDWEQTIDSFTADSKALENIIKNPATDLYKKIPHGTGQTILREILVVADHTSYHLGEFAIMRQVMETWGKSHK